MMDLKFIARPYAKALFAHAIETNTLNVWLEWLDKAASVVNHKEIARLIANPEIEKDRISALFMKLLDAKKDSTASNLLTLLVQHHRLPILPAVSELFAKLYEEHNKQVDAEVTTAMELTPTQNDKLMQALEKKLQRKVHLHYKIDKTILGGATIRVGDFVIDGSGRGRLNQLRDYLEGK